MLPRPFELSRKDLATHAAMEDLFCSPHPERIYHGCDVILDSWAIVPTDISIGFQSLDSEAQHSDSTGKNCWDHSVT